MNYCRLCILPDTRPNLVIGPEGICNACLNHQNKPNINWEEREINFQKIVKQVKCKSSSYDCLIPVSGGKDSTWQTHMCLKYGLTPLAVTWATPARTEIGQKNLQNLIDLGVDHIDYRINPKVEKKFMWKAFQKYGSTAIPMHLAIFSIPLNIANKFDIPLIIYGENSAFEYGGNDNSTMGYELNEAWFQKYGVTHGTTLNDWVKEGFSIKDLSGYTRPSPEDLQKTNTRCIFLGQYFNWDPEDVKNIAESVGFNFNKQHRKTGFYDYADIDDDFISIHHWMKWYKFGFTRLQDNLSLEIRNKRIKRHEAIEIMTEMGDQTPIQDIEKCCDFMKISTSAFYTAAETFRNKDIWKCQNGKWSIRNFIINSWEW